MSLNISSDLVPQVVNNYNAYTGDDKMIGLADEVTLCEFHRLRECFV